jgi:hypothetical protein
VALWRNIGGVTTIVPGATHFWEYTYGGRDVGVAIAAPNLQQAQINAELVALEQGVVARQSADEGGPPIHYTVRIRNVGSAGIDYNLNIGDWL